MADVCRFYLRGNCKFGARCRYRHDARTGSYHTIASQQRTSPRSEPIGGQWYSVPLPKGLPIGLVAGTGLHKLYPIEEGLKPRVVRIRPSDSEVSFIVSAVLLGGGRGYCIIVHSSWIDINICGPYLRFFRFFTWL